MKTLHSPSAMTCSKFNTDSHYMILQFECNSKSTACTTINLRIFGKVVFLLGHVTTTSDKYFDVKLNLCRDLLEFLFLLIKLTVVTPSISFTK